MSVFGALTGSNTTHTLEQAFGAKDVTTPAVQTALGDWYRLYYAGDEKSPPECEWDNSQRLPCVIVNKLTKAVFAEYAARVALAGETPTPRERFFTATLAGLDARRALAMQHALVGGEALLKPVFGARGLYWMVVPRVNYCVFARGPDGEPTDIAAMEQTALGRQVYTLAERRTVGRDGALTIESRLYMAPDGGGLGVQVPLDTLPQYGGLQPVVTLPGLWSVGLARLRTPMLNCVDGSPAPVSVYAACVGLLHRVQENDAQFSGEFERGQSRIIAAEDMLYTSERDGGARKRLKDNVFTALDDDPGATGVTIFSPALREQSYLARDNALMRRVENLIGLKRGILSEVEAAQRTATEITSTDGEYNLTIIDFQGCWEAMLHEAVALADVLGQLYRQCPKGDAPELAVDWGNGILYDDDKERRRDMEMAAAGLLRGEIVIARRFGLPYETPEDLQAIREKYMPELEELAAGEV